MSPTTLLPQAEQIINLFNVLQKNKQHRFSATEAQLIDNTITLLNNGDQRICTPHDNGWHTHQWLKQARN